MSTRMQLVEHQEQTETEFVVRTKGGVGEEQSVSVKAEAVSLVGGHYKTI